MANILIIDDDPHIRALLTGYLNHSHSLMVAETLEEGLDIAAVGRFDLVLLDVNLPDGSGLDAMSAIRRTDSAPEVIIITADGSTRGAEMAINSGAWDYILKPFSDHEIRLNVKRSLEFRASKTALKAACENTLDRSAIIGSSPGLMARLNLVAQCAQSDANVLLTGQTGTGKELFAATIHKNSSRKQRGFIVVDCAALPEQLVESVLFGHVKGAYTGANSDQEGLVGKADGGTLFLDEIGELPLSLQKKFLRVLQERRFKPVGGTRDFKSDFRLISATNRDLEGMVEKKEFRNDLLFRLKTIHIDLPPLRECKEDIKALTLHYIHSLCNHYGYQTKGFVPDFLKRLETYDWPGNTRELISSLEKAILSNPESEILYPNYLPNQIRLHHVESSIAKLQNDSCLSKKSRRAGIDLSIELPGHLLHPIKPLKQVKDHAVSETEKRYLKLLIRTTKGDLDKACSLSCISKSRLYALLKKYHISRQQEAG